MPLKPGSSDATIGANIAELRRAGYPADQAAAIAYHEAGRGGRGYVADVLAEVEKLVRQGWPRASAIRAAEYAMSARGYEPRLGIPSLEERTAFDMPIDRFEDEDGNPRGADDAEEVRVPETPQATNYTCGPAALRGALAAFGIGATEDALAAEAGTTAQGGTSIEGLADAAEAHGLEATIMVGLTIDGLAELLAEGAVVIACIQAGPEPENDDASHWVVPCVVRREGEGVVECMDPAVDDVRSTATFAEFDQRWHGLDEGERVVGLALVLRGDSPATMTALDLPQTPF